MGSGKGGGGPQITEYSMSAHYGICLAGGTLKALYFGEKLAWTEEDAQDTDSNSESISGAGVTLNPTDIVSFPVSKPDLFGGEQKEGGVAGTVYWLPGAANQVMPEFLAAKLGRTSATMTGYRGLASIFLTGASGGGFVWGKNNPYLKALWAKIQRFPTDIGLDDDLARIGLDSNPAHIIYECLTSKDCMGAPASLIDTASFNAAAQIFFDESFGLTMGWFEQASVENFISEVLDHVVATVFIQPSTGLFTIKVLRDDYVVDDLLHFDESNSKLEGFQRKGIGECVNEVSVEYTNPENEEQVAVTAQDLGNIIAQGGIVSTSRNYYGIRNPTLAGVVAQRDVAQSSSPLGVGTLWVNRTAWDSVPGGCIRVSNEKQSLVNVVFRITGIDRGKVGDARIGLQITEDIFGYEKGDSFVAPETLHSDAGTDPEPPEFSLGCTMPGFFAAQYGRQGLPADPNVFGAVLGTSDASDVFSFELWVLDVNIAGDPEYVSLGNRSLTGRGTLTAALDAEVESGPVEFNQSTTGTGPVVNGFALIQGATEGTSEIVFLRSFSDEDSNSNSGWMIDRGMLDTTPHEWPSGTPVWYLNLDAPFGDPTVRAPGEVVTYKLLPRTTRDTLTLDQSPPLIFTLSERTHAPSRPANVKVNTEGFSTVDAIGDSSLEVSWANRDRSLEETQIFTWDAASQTLPAGQTTTVRLLDVLDNVIIEHDSLTGTSYSIPDSEYAGYSTVKVQVVSELDGIESISGHTITVQVESGGFGLAFGFNFGENT